MEDAARLLNASYLFTMSCDWVTSHDCDTFDDFTIVKLACDWLDDLMFGSKQRVNPLDNNVTQ